MEKKKEKNPQMQLRNRDAKITRNNHDDRLKMLKNYPKWLGGC